MKKSIVALLFLVISINGFGQCDPSVPLYVIDLSANADTTWTLYEENALDRNGQCCSAGSNENCIQFIITLHPNSAGIFFDYDGAGAFGSLNWQIDCGPLYNMNDTICVTDPGPFTLTFCKPGSDNGNYTLISVPKPTYPEDQFVPANCEQPVEAIGVTESTITWQSISPGAPGDYNGLLSCVDCLDPVYTPDPNGPVDVEFEVCGYPILDYCVGNFVTCDTVKFTTLDSVLLNVTPLNPAFCSGGSVTLTASGTGGDNNFSYYWYDNSLNLIGTGSTLDVSVAGSYSCEVRDGNYQVGYCDGFIQTITVVETFPPVVDAGFDTVLCATSPIADLTGSIQYATGGTWTGGAGTYTPSNTSLAMSYTPTQAEIAAGSVVLTLTSTGAGASCPNDSNDVEIFFIDTLKTDLADLSLDCFGTTTAINPTITGGLAPLTYSWTNGATTANNDLGVGTHCLTITDANGCQTTDCMTITSPSELTLSMSSTAATTNGGNDGTATATPSGGTGAYTYLWNTAGTNQTENGLSYGIYTVTVTDDNGCERNGSVVVNEPQCNGFTLTTDFVNVLCNSDSTGQASVEATGGTMPYTYLWNDGGAQSTDTAFNLPAGSYEVLVTDGTGCFAIATVGITEPSALLNAMTHTDVSVQGDNDGDAQANVIGGTGSYYYDWSTAETTASINTLVTGWYYVEIMDDNGCTLNDSVFISEPPCNEFALYVNTVSPLCSGDLTGEASLTITNGVGPYSITWSTGETDVLSISGAGAGIHTVEATDAQGCYTFLNFGISEPSPVSIALLTTPSTCNGSDNGTIDMTVTGGTYPYYSFAWGSGQLTEDIINLSPGNYTITVTDLNGCEESSFTSISEPNQLSVSYAVQHVTCFAGTDGSIDVTPSGGVGGYTFDWSNGATTEDLTGIDVGGYILNVIDGNSCDFDIPITILVNEPEEVVADSINIACPVPGSGVALVDVYPDGGNTQYTVSFDGGSSYLGAGVYSTNLPTGASYDVTILDVNDCPSQLYNITVAPDLVIDSVEFNECYLLGQTDETVTVYMQGGSPDYAVSFDNGSSYGSYGVYSGTLPVNGSYNVLVQDDSGCVSLPFAITLPDVFTASAVVSTNYNGEDVSCNGFTDGAIDATVGGGTSGYTYEWDTNPSTGVFSTDQDPSGVGAGDYVLVATDVNGCQVSTNVTLTEPLGFTQSYSTSSYASGDNISCNGLTDGSIDFTISGGTGILYFDWDNDGTGDLDDTEDQNGLSAGTYVLVGEDDNGCTFTQTVVLTEPTALVDNNVTSTNPSGDNISCNGFTDGTIDYTVSGGAGSYTYDWDNDGIGDFDDVQDLNSLGAGTYIVVAMDLNGCTINDTVVLTEPTQLLQGGTPGTYPSGDNISCNGFANGSIDYSISGGSPGYIYNWSTSNGSGLNAGQEDQSGLTAGTYDIEVTDTNGCMINTSFTLIEPTSLTQSSTPFVYPSGDNVSCYAYSDGSIDYSVSGGSMPYIYDWDNDGVGDNDDTQDLSDLTAGTYIIVATDTNGCFVTDTITLTEPAGPTESIVTSVEQSGYAISCYNASDGWIDYTITGGAGPYTFDWDNDGTGDNDDTEDLSGLSAGTYNVIATDVNGCMLFQTVTLVEPDSLMLSGAITNATCYNYIDGAIDITVTGGTVPYVYEWSTSATTEDILGLTDGSYTVSITDSMGCTQSGTFVVTEPDTLIVTLESPLNFHDHNIDLFGGSDGSIDATTTGGTMPYDYMWSNGSTTEDLEGLTAGSYTVEVYDINGCYATASVVLTEPLELELPTAFSPNGDNYNDIYEIHGIEAYPDNVFQVFNRWGNLVFEAKEYNNTWNGESNVGGILPDGVYFVILVINDGEIEENTYVHLKTH